MTDRERRQEYKGLRKLAEQRNKRLQAAGFKGFEAPKLRDIEPGKLGREMAKLKKWLAKEEATVKGARAVQARKEEEAEQRRIRHNQQNREWRRRKAEREGRELKPRPPKQSEEERREKHRIYQREYRARKRLEKQLEDLKAQDKTAGQALQNLLSGLKKYGIQPKDLDELRAWARYIQDRKNSADPLFYEFDQWLEDVANTTGQSITGADRIEITADQIYNIIERFENFRTEYDQMAAELHADRRADEYGYDDFKNAWESVLNNTPVSEWEDFLDNY